MFPARLRNPFGVEMNMKKVLHLLIIAEIVFASLGIIIDLYLEKTLPQEIQEYIVRSEMAEITYSQFFAVIFGVLLIILLIVAWIGLWKLWRPARRLYTLCWLCGLPIYLFLEPVVYYTPLGAIFSEICTLSAGMIFGAIYFSELKMTFMKQSTEHGA